MTQTAQLKKYHVTIGIGIYNSFGFYVEGNSKNEAINKAKKQAMKNYGVRFSDCQNEGCRAATEKELFHFN